MALRKFQLYIFVIVIFITMRCNFFKLPTKGNDIYSQFPKKQHIDFDRLPPFKRVAISESFYYIWILFHGDVDLPQEHVIVLNKKMEVVGAKYLAAESVYKISGDTLYCYRQSSEYLAKQKFWQDDLPKSVVMNSEKSRTSTSTLRTQDIMFDGYVYSKQENSIAVNVRRVKSDYFDGAETECLETYPKSEWFDLKIKLEDMFWMKRNRSFYFLDSLRNERHIFACDSSQIVNLRKQIIRNLGTE
jgi:hypothetical protein